MKELLGINKENKQGACDGFDYKSASIDESLQDAFEQGSDVLMQIEETDQLPVSLRILKFVVDIVGLIALCGIMRRKLDVVMMASIVVLIACVLLRVMIIRKKQAKHTEVSEATETIHAIDQMKSLHEMAMKHMDVPEDTPEMDAFMYTYKCKDGKNIVLEKWTHFVNIPAYIFIKGDSLIIATNDMRFDILRKDIHTLDVVYKKQCMDDWIKDIPFDQGEYKQYKVMSDKAGRIWIDRYCTLQFRMKGEEFIFRFPIYEKENVEKLLGIKA